MERYKIIGRVGQGAHGFVVHAIDSNTGDQVALKRLFIKSLDEGIPKNIMREITALRVLKHDNIVQLMDVIPYGMGLVLIMEYLPSNLHLTIQSLKEKLIVPIIKSYLWMLLSGVSYMHENNIMHRDLKPTNVLISETGELKIADFGLARIYVRNEPQRLYTHQVATRWYRAPELLYGARKYSIGVDMWAVGCILAEMLNRTPLFPGDTDIEQLAIVLHTLGTPTEGTWPGLDELPDYNKITFAHSIGLNWHTILPNSSIEARNMTKSLIIYDANKRLTAKAALQHNFFTEKPNKCPLLELPKPSVNSSQQDNETFAALDKVFNHF